MDRSVLCWLATVSSEGMPNVSPKEIFTHYGEDQIIIANIASPQSVRNIKSQSKVCISFIDILVQKGYQLKGRARIAEAQEAEYVEMQTILKSMTKGLFPIISIIVIQIADIKPIIAPNYVFYPETTEAEQVAKAKEQYGLK